MRIRWWCKHNNALIRARFIVYEMLRFKIGWVGRLVVCKFVSLYWLLRNKFDDVLNWWQEMWVAMFLCWRVLIYDAWLDLCSKWATKRVLDSEVMSHFSTCTNCVCSLNVFRKSCSPQMCVEEAGSRSNSAWGLSLLISIDYDIAHVKCKLSYNQLQVYSGS